MAPSRITLLLTLLLVLLTTIGLNDPAAALAVTLGLAAFFGYFLPAMVASGRKGAGGPQVLNLFLGWSGLGWIIALAWAASLPRKDAAADGTFKRVVS